MPELPPVPPSPFPASTPSKDWPHVALGAPAAPPAGRRGGPLLVLTIVLAVAGAITLFGGGWFLVSSAREYAAIQEGSSAPWEPQQEGAAGAPQEDDGASDASDPWKHAPEPGDPSLSSTQAGTIDGLAIGVFRAETADVNEPQHGRRFELGVTERDGAAEIEYLAGTGLRSEDCDPGATPVSEEGLSFLHFDPTYTTRGGKSAIGAQFDEDTVRVDRGDGESLKVAFDFTTGEGGKFCRGTVHFTAHRVDAQNELSMWDAILQAAG